MSVWFAVLGMVVLATTPTAFGLHDESDPSGATFHWDNGTLALDFADPIQRVGADVSHVRITDDHCGIQFTRGQYMFSESDNNTIVINTTAYQRDSLASMLEPFVIIHGISIPSTTT